MNQSVGRVCTLPDPSLLVRYVAERLTAAANGSFRVSLSGGSTPGRLYSVLASSEFRNHFSWRIVEWYCGDERLVPYDDPESDYQTVHEAMLAKAPIPPENIRPIPADESPEEAALRYERTLQEAYGSPVLNPARPFSDVTLLGLGTDGQTAWLLPEEPVLKERKRLVVAVSHGRPEIRITTTHRVIESSRRVTFLVTGKEKATILRSIRVGGSQVPAAQVQAAGELFWYSWTEPRLGNSKWLVEPIRSRHHILVDADIYN